MRLLRNIFLLLFPLLFFQSNALRANHQLRVDYVTKGKVFQKGKFFCDNGRESGDRLKRKIKPKGREVAEPEIPVISFKRFSCYQKQSVSGLSEARSSLLCCLPGKRGPPRA